MSSSSSSSSPQAGLQIGQKRKRCFDEWEPHMLLEIAFFQQKNLVGLLRDIHGNFSLDWRRLPFRQKYYGFARQCFVRKMSAAGHPMTEAFEYIEHVKNHDRTTTPLEDVVDVNILYEYENLLVILD